MSTTESVAAPRRGRPRAFDREQALDAATRLFWTQGYEGASVAELTEAMGIHPPSLYACFGSKEGLFRAALDHYLAGPAGYFAEALKAPTARAVAAALLLGAPAALTCAEGPCGCLLLQAGLATGTAAAPMRDELRQHRLAGEAALIQRLAQARDELPPGTCPETLARLILAQLRGMAIAAADGASRQTLSEIAAMALAGLPLGRD